VAAAPMGSAELERASGTASRPGSAGRRERRRTVRVAWVRAHRSWGCMTCEGQGCLAPGRGNDVCLSSLVHSMHAV
jgi:hypothetical protein